MRCLTPILLLMVSVFRKHVHGRASVKVIPNSAQLLQYKKASISCEEFGPGNWTVWRFTNSWVMSECGSGWGLTETNSSVCILTMPRVNDDSGLYWCESKYRRSSSNSINITVTNTPVILETPVQVEEGLDVVLNCKIDSKPSSLTVEFYRDDELLKSSSEPQTTIRFSRDQEGAYTCRINGQSSPPVHMYLPVQEDSPAPVLVLNPDSEQFCEHKSVKLSCEPHTEGWTVHRHRPGSRTWSQCGLDWGLMSGFVCEVTHLMKEQYNGVYWCGKDKRRSNSVKLLVKNTGVVLQVPELPVLPGITVNLTCQKCGDSGDALTARFYKDGQFLSEEPTGHLTLQQVAVSDEGLYHCEIGGTKSQPSRLRVRAVSTVTDEKFSEEPLSLLLYLRYIIVAAPYVISSVFYICIYRQIGGSPAAQRRTRKRKREYDIDPAYEDVVPDVTTEYQF
ncbi:hypothetical protein WMY93_014801 [Mugilogobius chulae]|uniref:Ig-like domain-containing protein n=1 Tax=Mugilogobius chulae TaxID=88201 RepID=A0AAW0P2M7_9GOBI